ncbi:MAG: type II toxin-antitoxin system HicB family antitoxin [Bacteroidetes bacterium]|nr:type II toxin-antitoxin system HicB family antitoxin [Bacteroidota bacterium]MCH8326885.1 type II toxin-antitoxin system HicB family antitoxin [Bacteroidota bacterium]
MLNYKGYSGQINYDDEMKILHGEVIDTRDVITFQGRSVDEIEKAFRESIDDYLDFCKERGEEPEKPFSGKFILRMPPRLHHKLYLKANRSGKSLNKWVVETLDSAK